MAILATVADALFGTSTRSGDIFEPTAQALSRLSQLSQVAQPLGWLSPGSSLSSARSSPTGSASFGTRRLELQRRELEREEHAAWERDMEALNTQIQRETEAERRRGIVEEVCSPFADLPYTVRGYQIPPGTCDAAKRRAHEELVRAGGGRAREELVQIVKQAREQVYAPLLKAQDDASAAAARAVAEREARLAQEREEAQRREQATISALPQGLETSASGADRSAVERELTEGADGDDELEDDTEDDLDFEDEPDGNEGDDDELDGDTEWEDEEEPAPVGLGGTLVTLGAIALGLVVLSKARSSSRVWISAPHHGGDGSFAVGGAPPGPQPPWREASETEIQQGLQDGALRRV